MHDAHATAHAAHEHEHIVPDGLQALVWVSLMLLTVITAGASILFPGRVGIGVAMVVTPLKAALILMFFMHLKYEKPVFRWMFLTAVGVLAVVMGLTFFDYSHR
ncbi:MAG: cytochrome C oxidase subunit IV family protein [Candidatus Krumholzibacteriia bacterium]